MRLALERRAEKWEPVAGEGRLPMKSTPSRAPPERRDNQ
jgi:hypothetical protein